MKEHAITQSDSHIRELQKQLRLITQEYRSKLLAELTQKSKEVTALRTEVETTKFPLIGGREKLKIKYLTPIF